MEDKMTLSKFADSFTTAGSLDSGNVTVDRIFAEAMIIAQPVAPLEEMGVIQIKDVGANTDKVVFTVMPESDFTWRTVDTRASELVTGGSLQQISAPTLTVATPNTKSATIFIHDNTNLVNTVDFKMMATIAGNQIKQKKILDAITEMTTIGNYDAATSIRNANGFTAFGLVAADDTLTPNDLTSAKNDLKGTASPIISNIALMHTSQLNQIQNAADFSPGQTTNSNFKRAKFDETGTLVWFDGMDIVELITAEYAQITTGSFNSNNGHFVIVGDRKLMLGRGENNRKNTVEDFRNPEQHGIRRTLNVNYDYVLKFPNGIRLLAATD